MNTGDLVLVERGRNKAICQVVWSADPASALRGQFAVQCVEGKTPGEEELQPMEEEFQPVILEGLERRTSRAVITRPDANRRRRPRFYVEGQVEVIDGVQHVAGEVQQISEYGASPSRSRTNASRTDFRLMVNVFDVSVAVTAQVKYLVDNLGGGRRVSADTPGGPAIARLCPEQTEVSARRRVFQIRISRPADPGDQYDLANSSTQPSREFFERISLLRMLSFRACDDLSPWSHLSFCLSLCRLTRVWFASRSPHVKMLSTARHSATQDLTSASRAGFTSLLRWPILIINTSSILPMR